MTVLCRDCLQETDGPQRCLACGSPRIVAHPEMNHLSIAHIDCDAFFAAVEKRDNPELRDKPVIIGGGRRGVVSTACYIARTYGVRSAMPMFKALAACPQAIVIKPNMEKYATVGRAVRKMMFDLTPMVEPLSIDEAFLDLTGTELLHRKSPVKTLADFARRVTAEQGITVSVGLSHNKFLAKIASDLDKPRGFSVIGKAETLEFLANKPVGLIWGVGRSMQEKLEKDGIRLIRDLRDWTQEDLFRRYGTEGGRLHRLSRGIDTRVISPERETKSVSAETTFDEDIRDFAVLEPILWTLCEKVARRMKAQGLATSGITLKLKTADFQIITRSRSGFAPTQLAKRLFQPARELLERETKGRTAFRLIGIGGGYLVDAEEADHGDLIDHDLKRDKAAETAMDAIRSKFGNAAVIRGTALKTPRDQKT
jgi:DNA polymerase IV